MGVTEKIKVPKPYDADAQLKVVKWHVDRGDFVQANTKIVSLSNGIKAEGEDLLHGSPNVMVVEG